MQYKAVLISHCAIRTAIGEDSFCSLDGPYAFQLSCGAVIDKNVVSENYGCSTKLIFAVLLVHLYSVHGTLLG